VFQHCEENVMWDVIKNAVTQLKDTLGIELPGLPVEVGSIDAASITEAATTATEGMTQSATTAVEGLTATAGEAVTAAGTRVTETVTGLTDAAR
jgi:hypothetical protein